MAGPDEEVTVNTVPPPQPQPRAVADEEAMPQPTKQRVTLNVRDTDNNNDQGAAAGYGHPNGETVKQDERVREQDVATLRNADAMDNPAARPSQSQTASLNANNNNADGLGTTRTTLTVPEARTSQKALEVPGDDSPPLPTRNNRDEQPTAGAGARRASGAGADGAGATAAAKPKNLEEVTGGEGEKKDEGAPIARTVDDGTEATPGMVATPT